VNGDAARREPVGTRIVRRVFAPIVGLLMRALAWSWRLDLRGEDPFAAGDCSEGGIFALWHRDLLVGAGTFRDSGYHAAISQSRDGGHIAAVIRHLGLGEPPRGSSSRGGVAVLKSMVRLVRSGHVVGVLPDGPRGPARVAKPGVLALARSTGAPIHPLGFAARPALRFGSWDRTVLPLPFARVVCVVGDPLEAGRGKLGASREQLQAELNARLETASEEAERVLRGG
jgi:lysophospholipid acyltransferase (LPLAT)-like uncharacterized protein